MKSYISARFVRCDDLFLVFLSNSACIDYSRLSAVLVVAVFRVRHAQHVEHQSLSGIGVAVVVVDSAVPAIDRAQQRRRDGDVRPICVVTEYVGPQERRPEQAAECIDRAKVDNTNSSYLKRQLFQLPDKYFVFCCGCC